MSSNQDWYICMQVSHITWPERTELCCVNISKLLCENSRPQLERLHKSEGAREGRYAPSKQRTLFKNSVTNSVHKLELDYRNNVVTTIDTKLYVLVRTRFVFQVYDPFHNLWKILPPPPFSDTHPKYCCKHFEWGHMLGVFDRNQRGPSYVFDTIEEKWMPAVGLPALVCALEFSGFIIGVPNDTHYRSRLSIVAYKLDENGLPDSNSTHTLDDELWELFYPPLKPEHVFGSSVLYRFGDDHVLLVSTIERIDSKLIVVAVFRVSISTVGGIPVVSAAFEHKQVYHLDNDSYIGSTFLMQNAPSYCTHISNMSLKSDQPLQNDDNDDDDQYAAQASDEAVHEQDDDIAPKAQTIEKKIRTDVEWDDRLKEKSMYMCFVENRTNSSVSYIIKAMKFSDLISTSSHYSNSKLHQVAFTSGCHLACLPSCGVFGSLILFAGGGNQDYLRVVQPIEGDEIYSDPGYDQVEVPEQVPICRDIYCYDVTSNDSNIKRFTRCFKGMKPQPVLAEVEGKLYALADSPKPKYMNPGPFFEIFDPIEKQWSPMPDPPSYTKFPSFSNYHAIAGTNLLSWGNESPGVFRFDMAADSVDKDWRLIKNSCVLTGDGDKGSTIVVDSDGTGGGHFVLFTYKNWSSTDLRVHLISREFDYVVCLPSLELPESVSSFLRAQNAGRHSSFVDLGDRRVCLVLSSPFYGPYSRTLEQLGEVDKMSVVILVFEFEVTENRESVAAEFVFHRMFEYFTNSDARRNPKTSDTHMVGAFLL